MVKFRVWGSGFGIVVRVVRFLKKTTWVFPGGSFHPFNIAVLCECRVPPTHLCEKYGSLEISNIHFLRKNPGGRALASGPSSTGRLSKCDRHKLGAYGQQMKS